MFAEKAKKGHLSCDGIDTRIEQLQSSVRTLEVQVRESSSDWERELKALQKDPHLQTQK